VLTLSLVYSTNHDDSDFQGFPMPRFVILRHEPGPHSRRPLHWDLMLELGDVLKTWALPNEPVTGESMVAEALPDHRHVYLDYSGPLSGDRGQVERCDHGLFEWIQPLSDRFVVELAGVRGSFRVAFARLDGDPMHWSVCFTSIRET
jgi:hypothetical protein